jgi:Lecithin retinol acyltransferase
MYVNMRRESSMTMPTYLNGELILPGQWVKVWVKAMGGIWHHGIVRRIVRDGDGFDIDIVHNVKNGGVIVSSLEGFSEGGSVFLEGRPSSQEHTRLILATAVANLRKPYSTFSQNCEHFCWFCYTWEPKSETVQAFVGLAAVVLTIAAFSSDSR